jgi:hypothetical protein
VVTIQGSSNPSGASYQWVRVSGPAVTLSGATTAVVSFTAPAVTADSVLTLLSGRGSKDPDGGSGSYLWVQTAGPAVALSSPRSATPSFTAPEVTRETTLSFRVIVTDNEGSTGSAVVNVMVRDVRRR